MKFLRCILPDVLAVTGASCVVAALWQISQALGLAALGALLILCAWFVSRAGGGRV